MFSSALRETSLFEWITILETIAPCILVCSVAWTLLQWQNISRRKDKKAVIVDTSKVEGRFEEENYPPVETLSAFQWEDAEPLQLRPFKPKYHLTMALKNSTVSDMILFDKTYLSRINLRRELMKQYPDTIIGADALVTPYVNEFYIWVFGNFLPTRYPSMFRLATESLRNLVTNEDIPLNPPSDTREALHVLGSHMDEDFLFLLPHSSTDGSYVLAGFCCCCPNGFDLSKLIGRRVREIHGPVPAYEEKLQTSMDRYFANVPVGKYVKRSNWGISTRPDLFAAFDPTHGHQGELTEEQELDISRMYLRCELQTLHRLPKTKGLIFAFHTYLYPLSDIKEDGSSPALLEAIAGLDSGNVPGMAQYKRRDLWGDMIHDYLKVDPPCQ